MQELANKLITQARGVKVTENSSASGRADNTVHARIRYGVWPFLSEEMPDVAMGLMVALVAQLQRWPDSSVYPLMVAASDEVAPSDDLPVSLSQFDVDDWQLDYLAENVAVWGNLTRNADGWQLEVSVENDLTQADVETYAISALRLGGLIEQLENLAARISTGVGAGYPRLLNSTYRGVVSASDEVLSRFLTAAFYWERALFLTLWDAGVNIDWVMRFENLLTSAVAVDSDFGGGLVTALLQHAMRPVTRSAVEDALGVTWDAALERLPNGSILAIGAAWDVLYQDRENISEATNVLEVMLARTGDAGVRVNLAELYRASGRINDAVETLQAGLEESEPAAEAYFYYASLLVAMYHSNVAANEFVLVDAPRRQLSSMLEEALAAFEAGLALMPDRLDMRQQRLLWLIETQDEALWSEFADLVEKDASGEMVRGVIENLVMLEDIEPGLDILADAIKASPERIDLRMNYAVALLQDEQYDEAGAELELVEDMTDDQAIIAEIEHLFLQVNDPDFEARLGELTTLLSAGRPLGGRDVRFLEDALEQAPTFVAGYLLLAQSYLNADADDRALEVLLDGQNVLPENAEITAQLARLLWRADEHDLAFDYLNKGLLHHPDDVTLLALSGRYLFDEGQDDEARIFLSRAESIDPQSRILTEVKRYIASQM